VGASGTGSALFMVLILWRFTHDRNMKWLQILWHVGEC
jgi:hypothetical protein